MLRLIFRFATIAWAAALLPLAPAAAQLVAFPGAEGFGRFATGGRGGDVYRVTNLNDSGAGSLRNGILTAPASGRTIVFDVAGTIHLTSRLSLGGRGNLTIAGQTAPAGGITLAHHEFRINDANNVIVQHLRFRTGDRFPATHAPAPAPTYDPDVIGVTNSTNVILDHLTASWGVDESVSVTNSSNNVTVQWSTITQGLYNANHSAEDDGVGHSYGSLLNGGNYSFHHNLYAHSKGRFPRAQWNNSDARNLALDWVNNVLYNAQDYFGNSDSNDPFSVNLVGNYAIRGPQSGSGTNFLFRPGDVDSKFYAEGNFIDADRDLLLDGALAPNSGAVAVFDSGAKTIVPARFDFPQVTTHSAEQAYIQVLSRAGASRYRDAIDRRTIRSVLNHLPGIINTQADWGGWPTLPAGSAAPDANADGVPDAWATANGFNTTTPLNATFAPDGYTYLEKYLHSLTPNAYGPTDVSQHTIRTSFGNGADAQVSENGGGSAAAGGVGDAAVLSTQWAGGAGATNQALVLRFDLAQVVPGSLTSARLDLTAASAIGGARTFMIYGVEPDAPLADWNEATVDFDSAPGLAFDGVSGTLGVDNAFSVTSHPDNPGVLTLGQITVNNVAAGDSISLTNPNLAVFLNLASYYEQAQSTSVVTLIVQETASAATLASFVSKEGDPLLAPRLVVDAQSALPDFDVADFNGDGAVDGDDLALWSAGFGMKENADRTNGDADLDGDVDGNDFLVWQRRLTSGTPGQTARASQVPEPAAGVLLAGLGAWAAGVRTRRRSTTFGSAIRRRIMWSSRSAR